MPATSSVLAPPIETPTDAGAADELGERRRVDRQRRAAGDLDDVPPRHRLAGRADAEGKFPRPDLAFRRGQADGDVVVAHRFAGDRDVEALPLLLGKRHGPFEVGRGDADAVAGLELEAVVAGSTRDVVDLDEEPRAVAGEQELRDAGADHHRIADQHVLDRMADAVARPGHGHDADGAVELRHVEGDRRLAVGADFDDAGIEGHQLLGGRGRGEPRSAAVAAGADLARHALHAVDEQAVEIADLDAELALAEIPVVRRGRLEVGEVEDAEVDRGDRDEGFRARLRGCRWRPGSSSAGAGASRRPRRA